MRFLVTVYYGVVVIMIIGAIAVIIVGVALLKQRLLDVF